MGLDRIELYRKLREEKAEQNAFGFGPQKEASEFGFIQRQCNSEAR